MTRRLQSGSRRDLLAALNRPGRSRRVRVAVVAPAVEPARAERPDDAWIRDAIDAVRLDRYKAACELILASDVMRVLQRCEQATGGRWLNDQHGARVRVAVDRWTGRPQIRRARTLS